MHKLNHNPTIIHSLVILNSMESAISWMRLMKNNGTLGSLKIKDNVTPGSWNSKVGTTGSNIECILRNRMMKIFWSKINDVKYNKPMVNPDFTSL